jgi:hypothetical protein
MKILSAGSSAGSKCLAQEKRWLVEECNRTRMVAGETASRRKENTNTGENQGEEEKIVDADEGNRSGG